MRWNIEDAEKLELQREFVDTAVIPFYSFAIDEFGLKHVREQNWLEEVCAYAEQQLTGRVMLFPTVYILDELAPFPKVDQHAFSHLIFVGIEDGVEERSANIREKAVFIVRPKETGYDIADIVREGKGLSDLIMDQWKKT